MTASFVDSHQENHVSSTQQLIAAQLAGATANVAAANVFMYVFLLLVEAMNVRQQAVVVDSKGMMANANEQNYLNQKNNSIQFEQVPAGAGNNTIQQIQAVNQQKSKLREDYQNEIILSRQQAQVQMTNTNTDVGQVQQDASEDSGWLQTLNTIGQLLAQMLQQ